MTSAASIDRFARYPEVYSKIILAVPADGTPLQLTLSSNTEAMAERLRFYNFLKFVRRNPRLCAHLHSGNRCNLITVQVSANTMSFSIRSGALTTLESAFEQTAGHMQISLPSPAAQPPAPSPSPLDGAFSFAAPDPESAPNLLDMLTAFKPGNAPNADDETKLE